MDVDFMLNDTLEVCCIIQVQALTRSFSDFTA